jgi:alpha-beta hydrolase superfamily lysophospholipase
MPIYVFSGRADPVYARTGLQRLEDRYRAAGISDLTVRMYEDGRHEMFNELNRDEVVRDLIAWLNGHLPRVR